MLRFQFCLDRIYRINRIVFKQVEQEMQEEDSIIRLRLHFDPSACGSNLFAAS